MAMLEEMDGRCSWDEQKKINEIKKGKVRIKDVDLFPDGYFRLLQRIKELERKVKGLEND